ncbi:MAG: hypothetical protein H6605_05870 [Flavobacteriales bacterium]|nr:hypothetical protein [Flavobacteriales bacterium]
MDRKKFITGTITAAFSLSAFGKIFENRDGSFKADCKTTNDILGPFYKSGSPVRSDLTFEGLEGNVIQLEGQVFKSDCITPLHEALVEIWHCNTKGEYDNSEKGFKHRGSFLTGKDGKYTFKTILPGKYLNGEVYRPSHIHYRVTAKNTSELISQIYFKGDPHIEKDPWASNKKAIHRILPIIPAQINGRLTVKFDIYMG